MLNFPKPQADGTWKAEKLFTKRIPKTVAFNLEGDEMELYKAVGAATGSIFLSPNEKRVAEDRRDLYWLYVVTHCDTEPKLEDPIKDPARFEWHEVKKVEHYRLDVNAMTQPMELKEGSSLYKT
jgi:hypothetical protein